MLQFDRTNPVGRGLAPAALSVFAYSVGRKKVNCPEGAREAGLGHDPARRFTGFHPAGRGAFPVMGKYPKDHWDGSDEHFALIVAFPQTPFTGDAYLQGGAKFPARKI